jgi:hypothetical protein
MYPYNLQIYSSDPLPDDPLQVATTTPLPAYLCQLKKHVKLFLVILSATPANSYLKNNGPSAFSAKGPHI